MLLLLFPMCIVPGTFSSKCGVPPSDFFSLSDLQKQPSASKTSNQNKIKVPNMGSKMGGKERGVSTGEFSLNKWKPLLCFKGKIAKWRHILITLVASWGVYANFQRYVSVRIRGSKTAGSVMWKTQTFKHHGQIALMLFQCKGRRGE